MSGPAEDGPEQNGPREDGLAARAAQVALNLFRGYGYTFYRAENDLRADDQRIRRMVSELLQQARKGLSEAEGRYRREVIPPLRAPIRFRRPSWWPMPGDWKRWRKASARSMRRWPTCRCRPTIS
ncbi:hypothetical protein ACFS32_08290 [Novosphingobium pokkalii]|uniref:hypothetical protein n=1 Tax=Novosphingobium pokkalii TaxID=1770194 RepID=UPI00362936B7